MCPVQLLLFLLVSLKIAAIGTSQKDANVLTQLYSYNVREGILFETQSPNYSQIRDTFFPH